VSLCMHKYKRLRNAILSHHIHMFVCLAYFYFVSHYGVLDVMMNLNEIGHDIIEELMWNFPP